MGLLGIISGLKVPITKAVRIFKVLVLWWYVLPVPCMSDILHEPNAVIFPKSYEGT